MIKVTKPSVIPDVIATKGKRSTSSDFRGYKLKHRSYKFNFKSSIYNHPTVKKELKKAQYDKCCYCEKKQRDEYGAVEHYRPKEGYRSNLKDPITKPGYFWLAYEWTNLYFVCGVCNTNKSYFFPVKDNKKRAKWYRKDLDIETPLLIDPCGIKDPRKHIKFNKHIPTGLSRFGRKTIEICKLDRVELIEERSDFLKRIDENLLILATKTYNQAEVVKNAENFIRNCQLSSSQFSAAATDHINEEIKRLKIKLK